MRSPFLATVCLVSLGAVVTVRLPQWLKPCYMDDPKLNECYIKHGKEAIPILVHGDKKLRMASLDPLQVTEIRIEKDSNSLGLGLVLKDLALTGLATAELQYFRNDFEKKHFSVGFHIPRFIILSSYEISGKVLLLPITGNGPANITCTNCVLDYDHDYDLEKRANGKSYIVMKNGKLAFNVTKAYFKLDNLFNGNALLGENMNVFLNENWKELVKELGPAVGQALEEAVKQVFLKLFNALSYEEMFPSTTPH